jgi:NodT family efflux transporter outer membrane factor (OMF) lipoprotein
MKKTNQRADSAEYPARAMKGRWAKGAPLFILGLALLLGCATVGPNYSPPETQMPDVWHQELTAGLAEGEADLQTWWTALNDPVLDELIQKAADGNIDLKVAVARIEEAYALRGIAAGQFYPDINADGVVQRDRVSEGVSPETFGRDRTDNFYGLGLGAGWEIDVWGRIRRSVEAADASTQAAIEDYRDILVLLFAAAASNYVEVRTLQARIQYAETNAQLQRETLQLTQDRFDAGIAPQLDVRQAELNLAVTESVIPDLESRLIQAINRLSVLLGEQPGQLQAELLEPGEIPDPPGDVLVSIPANLLRQRPDIRGAERRLASQTARIGVAQADLYPRFDLFGTIGLEAFDTGDYFDAGNKAWSLGSSLFWNIFDGGRIRSNIRVEEARTEQAFQVYEQTVLLALEDVEDAMVAYVREQEREEALGQAVTAAEQSVELVDTLYRTGLTDFQNVLDMQRSLATQQDNLAQSEGNVVTNVIRVYRALGGGWSIEAEETAVSEEKAGDSNG